MYLIRLAVLLLLAGCTQYVPFKDDPAARPPAPVKKSAIEQKREACRARGGTFVYLQGDWHCLAPKP